MTTEERIVIPRDNISFEHEGKTIYIDEMVLAQLLLDGVCHLNNAMFHEQETVCAFVNCSDVFAWACADSEPVLLGELPALYEMHMQDTKWGSAKWAILHRKEYPQSPVLRDMKADGVWDIDESLLQANWEDAETQALFAHAAAQAREEGRL